jgi:hypothetical protein
MLRAALQARSAYAADHPPRPEGLPTTHRLIVGRDYRMTIGTTAQQHTLANNNQGLCIRGRIMPGGRPAALNPFICPNCGAFYQVVKVEAGPETDNREISCRVCDWPLAGRENQFVLKYFLLRPSRLNDGPNPD